MNQFDEATEALIAVREAQRCRAVEASLLAEGTKREWRSASAHNLPADMVCPVCGVLKSNPMQWQYYIASTTMCLKCYHKPPRRVYVSGLYKARKKRGLSQTDLAALLGMHRSQWNRVERQSSRVAFRTAARIAEVLPWRPKIITCWNRHFGPPWRTPFGRPEHIESLGDAQQYHTTEVPEPRPTVPVTKVDSSAVRRRIQHQKR